MATTSNYESYELLQITTTPAADVANYMHVIREPDYLQVVDEHVHLQALSHTQVAYEPSYLQVVDEPEQQTFGTTSTISGENVSRVDNDDNMQPANSSGYLKPVDVMHNRVNNIDDDGYWLVHDVQTTQGIQLGDPQTIDRLVNIDDDGGTWQVLNGEQRVPSDVEAYLQAVNDNNLALSEQSDGYNQRVRQAASVDSYGYLQPVDNNDAEVHPLPTVYLNSNDATAVNYNTNNLLHPLYTAQGDTPPNHKAMHHLICRVQNSLERRPRLPTPRVTNQPTSNTTCFNLKLPLR
jgi:hypothetical protein